MARVLTRDDPAVRDLPLQLDRLLPHPAELGPRWSADLGPELRVPRCDACGWLLHPPLPACRRCGGRALTPVALSGRGDVHAATVNHHPWEPELAAPYAIAVVELVEQPGLRLTTSVIGLAPSQVRIGLAVQVAFVAAGDLLVPVFEPAPRLDPDGGAPAPEEGAGRA